MAAVAPTPSGERLAGRLLAQARTHHARGARQDADWLLRAAFHAAPASPSAAQALRGLWQIGRAERDWPRALAAGLRAAQAAPHDFPLVDAVVRTLGEAEIGRAHV